MGLAVRLLICCAAVASTVVLATVWWAFLSPALLTPPASIDPLDHRPHSAPPCGAHHHPGDHPMSSDCSTDGYTSGGLHSSPAKHPRGDGGAPRQPPVRVRCNAESTGMPPPPHGFTPQLDRAVARDYQWLLHYRAVYEREMANIRAGRKARVAIHRGVQMYGWGNRLRNLMTAMLYSLATDRVLFVDHPQHQEQFLEPEGFQLYLRDEEAALHSAGMSFYTFIDDDINKVNAATSADLNERFNYDVLVFHQGWDFDDGIFNNVFVREKLVRIFGGYSYHQEISERVFSWLFSKPRPELVRDMDALVADMGLRVPEDVDAVVAFQYRAFVDDGKLHSYQQSRESVWRCVSRDMSILNRTLHEDFEVTPGHTLRIGFFLTSDAATEYDDMISRLSQYGKVAIDPTDSSMQHTAGIQPSKDVYTRRVPLLHWYFTGMADYALCTGTTFCYTARSMRVGGLSRSLITLIPSQHRCGAFQHGRSYADFFPAEEMNL